MPVSCPVCRVDLSAVAESAERCPSCGSALTFTPPAEGTQDSGSGAGGSGAAAELPPRAEGAPPVRPHLRTFLDRTQAAGGSEPLIELPQSDDVDFILADDGPQLTAALDSDLTMAFVPADASLAGEPAADPLDELPARSLETNRLEQTIDAGAPGADESLVTGMWQSTVSPDTQPGMTIKAASPGSATQTHLVVRPRLLRERHEKMGDGADYELLDIIGEGGMGVVYSARQASIDRNVAIKMIRREMAGDNEQRQKFLSEAVVTGELDHPNIVPIYDLGSNETGALFYSMKRVHGTPWMKVIRQKGLAENLEILLKVADAVAFAHSRGVVHRDLKPENVMLGDFGEVLVMDWGLALAAPQFKHLGSITQSGGMGGTPAYMAPEMATGPMDRIGVPSDVYLLGAMLFEIMTGTPPHMGKDVMACLHAVARNEIRPTDKTGELMDIARKAMATRPADRYASVQDFQAALRLYQSHSESILLSSRAEQDFQQAEHTNDYQDYARALFGFQEALALWDANEKARTSLVVVKLAYARSAMAKGDLDLAASLLEADEPTHADLRNGITIAVRERDARQQRLKYFRRVARGLVATILLVIGIAYFGIRAQRDRAVTAERDAMEQRDEAMRLKGVADDKTTIAVTKEAEARTAESQARAAENQANVEREKAEEKRVEAEKARAAEELAKMDAKRSEREALVAKDAAEAAKRAEELARQQKEYDAYIAQIGLVAAKIDENAFGFATQLLDECNPRLRHWEWGRLMRLCRQSARTFREQGPIDAVAYSPDGRRAITGSWEGAAHVWDLETGQAVATLQHGLYVHAVAFSHDGRRVATGSNDETGEVRVWDAESGALLHTLDKHGDSVLSVAFSRDGRRLLTGSYDNTARLWDIESGDELRAFVGHTWWVWSAAFSPDEKHVVTASQDGSAMVWSVDSDQHGAPFGGHAGPVYSAAFSPDGTHVVSAGYDKRVLVWRPDDVRPFDFGTLAGGQSAAPPVYATLAGHTAAVRCARFSPDGRQIVSGSHDNTVKVWDAQTGACVKTLRGHAGWVRACSFSPDGRAVLSAGYDHQAKLWDVAEYEETRPLLGHTDAILSAAFSPDGRQVVTASRDRSARVYDAATGADVATLHEGHAFLVASVAFSPDGRHVITGAGDNTVRVWDRGSGTQLLEIEHTGRGGVMKLSRSGRLLLTGGDHKQAQLWDASTGQLLQTFAGHKVDVTAVAIADDEKTALTADGKGHAKLWSVETGRELARLDGHSRKITAAEFLPGGKRALTASADNSVGHWDVQTGQELVPLVLKHPDSVVGLAVSPDGTQAVTACADHRLRLWRIDAARPLRTIETGGCELASVAFSPDGRQALAACSDNKVRLWDLATGREMSQAQRAGAPLLDAGSSPVWAAIFSPDATHVLTGGGNDAKLWDVASGRETVSYSPHGTVASAHFSSDGRRVVTGSWDGTVKIWDLASNQAAVKLAAANKKYINTVCYSPDGAQLLTASDDGTAKLWDAATGAVVRTFPEAGAAGHVDRVRAASFSADGARIVTASNDKTARIWDAATGAELTVLKGHAWAVLSARFSDDGQRVITGGEDNTARIWDAASGRQLQLLAGHTAAVASAAFSPDGRRAVTGSQDDTVKVWDTATAREILTLKQHAQEVTSVTFSPDGKSVLTASRDGTAILWPAVDWE